MESGVYAVEASVEEHHWWFVGRRELFAREITNLHLPSSSTVVDVGTGTGAGLRLLRNLGFTDVCGVDTSDDAIRYCTLKGLGPVEKGDACRLPFPDGSKQLVCATDIIEHIDDDAGALAEIARVLARGGYVLLAVPTFASLWGLQDDVAHHKRRYRLRRLLEKIKNAGVVPVRAYYFNYILFGPIWLARQIIRLLSVRLKSEAEVNSPAINRLLVEIFRFDCRTAPYLRPPFGVSALVVAKKL